MDERIEMAIEQFESDVRDNERGTDPEVSDADVEKARTALEEAIEDYADAIHRSALSRGPGIP
jgi:NACalpha-BTF3-like transcription factor